MRPKESLEDEVYRVLSKNPGLTSLQLACRVGRNRQTTLEALNRLRKVGRVESQGPGTSGKPYRWITTKEQETNG